MLEPETEGYYWVRFSWGWEPAQFGDVLGWLRFGKDELIDWNDDVLEIGPRIERPEELPKRLDVLAHAQERVYVIYTGSRDENHFANGVQLRHAFVDERAAINRVTELNEKAAPGETYGLFSMPIARPGA